jgi:type I restriction enzyme R subunit
MTEDQLEQEALGWLAEVGYTPLRGPELAPDGERPERSSYQQVLLVERLRAAIARLNPQLTTAAREDALQQVRDLGIPRCCRPTGASTSCWSPACRSRCSVAAKPWATSPA